MKAPGHGSTQLKRQVLLHLQASQQQHDTRAREQLRDQADKDRVQLSMEQKKNAQLEERLRGLSNQLRTVEGQVRASTMRQYRQWWQAWYGVYVWALTYADEQLACMLAPRAGCTQIADAACRRPVCCLLSCEPRRTVQPRQSGI